MDYSQRLAISYYQTIATLNESHKIYLVQHQETKKIYVKKILDVYNKYIYQLLLLNPIDGIPKFVELYEEDGHLTVIENYVSGCSLLEKMTSGNMNIDLIYQYGIELCSILEKLHSFQPPIIHRDIKPSNIIITEYDHVMLLDFNAAKYFTESTNSDTVLLGTKGYAAPEQFGFGSSTPKTDIYALGILLKEMAAVLPSIPKELNRIIAKCIQMNPADRYQSVTELKTALEQTQPYKEKNSRKLSTFRSILPPGFRTLTPWKMIVSSMSYLFIFWLSMGLEVENTYGAALWFERIFCLLIFLSVVFVSFNYLNIQKGFPLCKYPIKIVHLIGVVLYNIIVVFSLFIIMLILESFLFT